MNPRLLIEAGTVVVYGAGCYYTGLLVGRWNERRGQFPDRWTELTLPDLHPFDPDQTGPQGDTDR